MIVFVLSVIESKVLRYEVIDLVIHLLGELPSYHLTIDHNHAEKEHNQDKDHKSHHQDVIDVIDINITYTILLYFTDSRLISESSANSIVNFICWNKISL